MVAKVLSDIFLYGLEKVSLYYSRYRGFVVDNNDPENCGRLRLQVPQVHGDQHSSIWAWPAGTFSGPGYGIQLIPPKNALVWVSFEFGNPRKPIWHHGYFGNGEIPEELQDINKIWLKTVKGFLIEIDDTENTLRVIGQDETEEEPLVLGDTLKNKLDDLVGIIDAGIMIGGVWNPATKLQFQNWLLDLGTIKSNNKTIGK